MIEAQTYYPSISIWQKQEFIIHFWYNMAGVTGANYCPDYYSSYIYMVECS